MSEAERAQNELLNGNAVQLAKSLEVDALYGEDSYSFYERTTARPTIEINGMQGGYTGENIKSIVPNFAIAKVSCRLVDAQDPDDIMHKIQSHIDQLNIVGVRIVIRPLMGGKPFFIEPSHPYIQKAAEAYTAGFGKPPVFTRSGGSIPIVQTFVDVFHVPVVMMDMGMPGENMHAPNEHFHLVNWDRGLATLAHFWASMDNAAGIK
jgi:acetylornithine deacetylase/succinyl-diaminopimelate desuccinylase-like protein